MSIDNKKRYITSTLPYVNSDPHLGFGLEIIQADVIARWWMIQGFEVFFNTGTDEHGLKIFRKAEENKMSAQEYCDIYAKKFDDLKQALNLSYNNFIRTTDPHHVKSAQAFWKKCFENGDIYKKNYKTKYCVGCEMEKTDSELENDKCPIHPNLKIEIIEEENYFFKYSKFQQPLLDFYEKNPSFVVPQTRYNEIKEFTKRGLEDFSISRLAEKMPWGVPVPNDEKHVMYVWFDALVNYISCLNWPEDQQKFNDFWPGMQVAGKDNLRHQTSMWQAMLMSAGLPNSKQVFIHGHIMSNGQKMSKSLGNVVNPIDLANKYSADAVRYYLLREIPSADDGDFTIEKFEQRYNADLANGIGNLVARTLALSQKADFKSKPITEIFAPRVLLEPTRKKCEEALKEYRFNEALKSIWDLIDVLNGYINEKKPWEAGTDMSQIVSDCLFIIKEIADLLTPFLPGTSQKIKQILQTGKSEILFPRLAK